MIIHRLLLLVLLLGVAKQLLGQNKRYVLLHETSLYFDSGKAKVKPQGRLALNEVIEALKSDTGTIAWIQAHTDSLGSYEDNERLSERRAAAVYDILVKKGVDTAFLDIKSLGEYVPLSTNTTAQGRALNRRVSIQVVRNYVPQPKDSRLFTVKGTIKSKKEDKGLKTMVLFNSLVGQDTFWTAEDGYYEYTLAKETPVEIRTYAKGYFFVAKAVQAKLGTVKEQNFQLEQARLGEKMALSNLYFRGGTPILLPSSEKSLQGLLAFMEFNESLVIEIGGHINKPNQAPVSKESSSFKLSEARAATVYYYLIENGIKKERLTYKGYGNSAMIYPRASNSIQEQMNRRVELTITGE